jgi:hypothetical protein
MDGGSTYSLDVFGGDRLDTGVEILRHGGCTHTHTEDITEDTEK